MQPGNLNLAVRAGDTYRNTFTWTNPASSDPSGRTPGTPIDLTGASCVFKMNQATFSSSAPSTQGSTITLGGAAGTILCKLVPADTATLTSEGYALTVTLADGTVSTLLIGLLEVI
jgi:hypothetical protein